MKKDTDFSMLAKGGFEKIVVNAGIGRISTQANFTDKLFPALLEEFATITGQKPQTRMARQSIAGFKIREGAIVGLRVTLRGRRMVDFLKKFITIVLPRVRDFRGIAMHAIDGNGNLNVGVKEHLVFPEISAENSKVNFGLEITMVPKLQKRASAIAFYQELGVPFAKEIQKGK